MAEESDAVMMGEDGEREGETALGDVREGWWASIIWCGRGDGVEERRCDEQRMRGVRTQLKKMKKPAQACTQAIWPPSGGLRFGVVVLVTMAAVWLSRSASSNLSRYSDVLRVLKARGAYNVLSEVKDGRLQILEDILVPVCRR